MLPSPFLANLTSQLLDKFPPDFTKSHFSSGSQERCDLLIHLAGSLGNCHVEVNIVKALNVPCIPKKTQLFGCMLDLIGEIFYTLSFLEFFRRSAFSRGRTTIRPRSG